MTKQIKFLLLIGTSLMAFSFGLTSPIVEIFFMKLISPKILAVSNVLGIGLAAIIQSSIPSTKCKAFYRRNTYKIISIVIILFISVSVCSMEYAEVRFLGFAVLNALTTSLWAVLVMDAVNHKIKGDELTNWNATLASGKLYASLIGCVFAIFIADYIPIEPTIGLQCVSITIYGICDMLAIKKMASSSED